MRIEARLKLGFYPLPVEHGPNLRARLQFPPAASPATALDPCAGQGAALKALTKDSSSILYGVELDANRAEVCKRTGIQTIQGNIFDVRARVERLSLLYLNPPYDFEIGELQKNQRMEKLFLAHTFSWLKPKGILVMVIPGKAIPEVLEILSLRFNNVRVYRMRGEDAEKYDQYAIFAVRHNNSAKDTEAISSSIKRMLAFYGPGAPDLTPEPDCIYLVPPGDDVVLTYSGIPLDEVEDRLIKSGAWANVAPLLLPKREVTGGRPITPLHSGHVGLLATAGMINGIFGKDDEKHIARWRPVKHTTVTKEEDEDGAEITRTRERFSNELALVYVCGTTMVLTENDKGKEEGKSQEQPQLRSDTPSVELEEEEEDDSCIAGMPLVSPSDLPLDQDGWLGDGTQMERKFDPGKIIISSGVHDLIANCGLNIATLLQRHVNGDWGSASYLIRRDNEKALQNDGGFMIQSVYEVPKAPGETIVIITEDDLSLTMIHLFREQ